MWIEGLNYRGGTSIKVSNMRSCGLMHVIKTMCNESLEKTTLPFGIHTLTLHVKVVLLIELYILMRLVSTHAQCDGWRMWWSCPLEA